MTTFPVFCRFPGFTWRACTMSFDDGPAEDARFIEIMRQYGLRGTFNLTKNYLETGWTGVRDALTVQQVKDIFRDDTEIALHGVEHYSLARTPNPITLHELIECKAFLEKEFGVIVRGIATPYGSCDEDVQKIFKMIGLSYARHSVRSTETFELPTDWLHWDASCRGRHPRLFENVDLFLGDGYFRKIGTRRPLLFNLWGHTYEYTEDNNWEDFERFCDKMANAGNVWFATNIEVYDYIDAFNRLVFSADGNFVENPSATDVYLCYRDVDVLVPAGKTVWF